LMPYTFGMVGIYGASVMLIMGVFFLWTATQFYRNCDDASAKRVLLMSFAYLPIVQLAMVLDRI